MIIIIVFTSFDITIGHFAKPKGDKTFTNHFRTANI